MIHRSRGLVLSSIGSLILAAALSGVAAADSPVGPTLTGPSSSQGPYVVPSLPGVVTKSLLTVGDHAPNSGPDAAAKPDYPLVGVPDGLGAFGDDGRFTLLVNHELANTVGVDRVHGSKGAFVSRWSIDGETGEVRTGADLISAVKLWDGSAYIDGTTAFYRLCSADLAGRGAYSARVREGRHTRRIGYRGRLFLNGEESGVEGRAFAHELNGTSWELPGLGNLSFENVVTHPNTGRRTVTISLDDSTPGQIFIHVGEKRASGNPVERAGLSGGTTYGVKVPTLSQENDATAADFSARFTALDLGDVTSLSGAQIENQSNDNAVTKFNRPEDGSWDPSDPRVFWFATTASMSGKSRLWKLTFDDPARPESGGTIEAALNGDEGGHRMFDNLTVNARGEVVLLEDPGNNDYVARVWIYRPAADSLTEVAHFDADRFAPGAPGFLTKDEESSGIIDAERFLGRGWYLLDAQAHYAIPGELAEGGQLLAIRIPSGRR